MENSFSSFIIFWFGFHKVQVYFTDRPFYRVVEVRIFAGNFLCSPGKYLKDRLSLFIMQIFMEVIYFRNETISPFVSCDWTVLLVCAQHECPLLYYCKFILLMHLFLKGICSVSSSVTVVCTLTITTSFTILGGAIVFVNQRTCRFGTRFSWLDSRECCAWIIA